MSTKGRGEPSEESRNGPFSASTRHGMLNRLASDEQVLCTPSRRDGVTAETEDSACASSCLRIQQAGVILQLPQVAMATAQVLFRRFWFVASIQRFNVRTVSVSTLLLASKIVEVPLRIRELLHVFDYLDGRCAGDVRDAVLTAEMQVLKRLGFHVHVELPYALMINYLQTMGMLYATIASKQAPNRVKCVQVAWNYLNDALQTPVYCLFPVHTIACTSIYLLTLENAWYEALALPLEPRPWWELFDTTQPELRAVGSHIMRLYATSAALSQSGVHP